MLNRTPRRAGHRGARGFSLIELLTAFVLLAILIRLALPSFTTWIANAKVRTVAESLQTGLHLAQAEAVRRNRQVVLSFTNGTPALNVAAAVNGNSWSLQTVQQFGAGDSEFVQGGKLTDTSSGVTINTGGLNALCFNSNGRLVVNASPGPASANCAAAAATFNISHSGSDRPLRVLVGVGGQVRMCDPNRPALSDASPDGCPA